jgi:dCTP deaminase
MVLSDVDIQEALSQGHLEINPPPQEDQYTTSALDLFLGNEFHIWDRRLKTKGFGPELNLAEQEFRQTAAFIGPAPREADGSVKLAPYGDDPWHLLSVTRETIHLKPGFKLAARVEGRSSLGRIGLIVHLTAPIIHAGFRGPIVLEMINFGPFHLRLVPERTRICQLVFERLETVPGREIATAFKDQTKPSGN